MVFGILTAVAACPAIIGTTEAIKQGQHNEAREAHRGRKQNLTVTLYQKSSYSARFDGAYIVLKNNKLWVDVSEPAAAARQADLHPFTGYFLPYPDMTDVFRQQGYRRGEGMVTTISADPPFLNWVFVDRRTHEVRYGLKAESLGQRVGPWDVTPTDRRLTFEGWEGFVAVEEVEGDGLWGLYFDCADDGLKGEGRIGREGKRMLALEVWRKDLRRDRMDALGERAERLRMREEESASASTDVS